jgi:hypothetical protein
MHIGPGMDRAMSFNQAVISANVNSRCDLARGRFRGVDLSRGLKASCYFYPEVYVHRKIPKTRVVIKEDVVPVSTKAWLPA